MPVGFWRWMTEAFSDSHLEVVEGQARDAVPIGIIGGSFICTYFCHSPSLVSAPYLFYVKFEAVAAQIAGGPPGGDSCFQQHISWVLILNHECCALPFPLQLQVRRLTILPPKFLTFKSQASVWVYQLITIFHFHTKWVCNSLWDFLWLSRRLVEFNMHIWNFWQLNQRLVQYRLTFSSETSGNWGKSSSITTDLPVFTDITIWYWM